MHNNTAPPIRKLGPICLCARPVSSFIFGISPATPYIWELDGNCDIIQSAQDSRSLIKLFLFIFFASAKL